MANKRIKNLPSDATPNKNDILAVDSATTRGVTIENAVKIGRPFASQAQAEAGTDFATAMNPLTTSQAIAAQGDMRFASAAQGAKADTAVQPARTITAGTGLTGGGDLSANRTVGLDSSSVASLALADTATQPGDLATVATSGEYDDLTGKPTLGTAAATDATDYATAAQGAKADSAMQPATYDPGGISDNAFDRTKHTGVMPNTGLQNRLREHVWNNLVADWNLAVQTGFYGGANAANGPTTSYYAGAVIAADGSGNRISQTVYRYANRISTNTETWQRTGQFSAGSWTFSAWYRLRLSEAEQQALWDARYVQPGDLGDLALKDKAAVSDIDATGTAGATTYLRGDGAWVTPAGGGDMLGSNNGSDFASIPDARENLVVPTFVDSRTAMKALATSTAVPVILTEAGREGQWVFRTGDFSAEVTADPGEGAVVKADDTAATTGVYARVTQGARRVKDFGAKGDGSTSDREAIQRAIAYTLATDGAGDIEFTDGTFLVDPVAAPDQATYGLSNGIIVPFGSYFEPDKRIRLVANGRAILKAGADDMSLLRNSRPGTEIVGLQFDGGYDYFEGAFDNVTAILDAVEDRTDDTSLGSHSFLTIDRIFVTGCAEGLYFETGPTVGGAGSGSFYPKVRDSKWDANTRHMYFDAGALAPDNRPTRGIIRDNHIFRGAIGVDLAFATEFDCRSNFFELLNDTYPAGPRGIRTAYYGGEFSELNTVIGGYAEDCEHSIYRHDDAKPNCIISSFFVPASLGTNYNATLAGLINPDLIRLVPLSGTNVRLGFEAYHAGFAGIYFDLDGDGTRNAGIRTNNTTRQSWGAAGGTTIFGSEGNFTFNSNGRTLNSSSATGLNLSTTAGGPVVLSNGGTSVGVYSTELRPVSGVSNLGIAATNTTGRWNTIFLQNAPDIASDAHFKDVDPSGWTEAELRVAEHLAGMIRAYRLKPEFVPEGEAAKRKAGVIAQEVVAAFADEGLDAHDYGMLSKGEFYGVVYAELHSFVIAGQEARMAMIERRLSALED